MKNNWIKRQLLKVSDAWVSAFVGFFIGLLLWLLILAGWTFSGLEKPSSDWVFVPVALILFGCSYGGGWLAYKIHKRYVVTIGDYTDADIILVKKGEQYFARTTALDEEIRASLKLPTVNRDGKFTYQYNYNGVRLSFEGFVAAPKEGDPLHGFSAEELFNLAEPIRPNVLDVTRYLSVMFDNTASASEAVKQIWLAFPAKEANRKINSASKLELIGKLFWELMTVDFSPKKCGLSCVERVNVFLCDDLYVGTFE